MKNYKEYIASLFKGKRCRFKCSCLIHLDVSGVILDTSKNGDEIIYVLKDGDRTVSIGENTPGLEIEFL